MRVLKGKTNKKTVKDVGGKTVNKETELYDTYQGKNRRRLHEQIRLSSVHNR